MVRCWCLIPPLRDFAPALHFYRAKPGYPLNEGEVKYLIVKLALFGSLGFFEAGSHYADQAV